MLTLTLPLVLGSIAVPPARAQVPAVGVNNTFVQPVQIQSIAPGATFTISIDVRDMPAFNAYDIRIGFDAAVLDATAVDFTGSMFAGSGGIVFTLFPAPGTVEELPGVVRMAQSLLAAEVSGSGRIARITFSAVATAAFTNSPLDVGCEGSSIAGVPAPAVCSLTQEQNIFVSSVTLTAIPHDTFDAVVNFVPPVRPTTTAVVCSPSSVVVGQVTSCTATVTSTALPTGTVSFTSSGSGTFVGSPCTLSGTGTSASCSVTYTPTPSVTALPRTDTITASYPGVTNQFSASSGTTTMTVDKRATSTAVACTPSTVVVNQATSCTVTVTDTSLGTAITPTGTVSLTSSGSGTFTACNLSGTGASASCTSSYTPTPSAVALPRTDTITATYPANANQLTSSGTASVTVNKRATATAVACTPSTVVVNQATSCMATVSDTSLGTAITPTGSVSFTSSGASNFPASCTLSGTGASASCTVTYTPAPSAAALPRTDTITGSYAGNANHLTSSGTASVTVNKRASSAVVDCLPATVNLGQSSTCTVTVTDASPGTAITPTGSVSFISSLSGSFSPAASCTLDPTGKCSVSYTPNVSGNHIITANYAGDANHNAAPAATDTVSVGVPPAQVTVMCTPNTVLVNQGTSCTATVTDVNDPLTTPTGSVSFTSSGAGSFTGSPCTLSGTGASSSCSVTYMPTPSAAALPRTDTVTGTYAGDAAHGGASDTASVTVNKRATATAVACTPSTVVVNQATSCMATVSDTSLGTAITPTGSVSFTSSGASNFPASCTLSGTGASASCTVTYTPAPSAAALPRTDTITANYAGDATHNTSSGTASVTVNKRATSTDVVCVTPVVVGQVTGCAAFVSDTSPGTAIIPTGTVSFTTSGTGSFDSVSCTLSEFTPVPGSARCGVSYTPGPSADPLPRTDTITGSYAGDANHNGSSGTELVTVNKRDTSTAVVCTPSAVDFGQSSSCTATVTDTSPGTAIIPTGSVAFSVSPGPGSFSAPSCMLSGTGASASCTVSYTPSGTITRTDTITGRYGGDANHNISSGTFVVTVGLAPDVTVTNVVPSPTTALTNALVGTDVTISVTVANIGTGSASNVVVTAMANSAPVCTANIASLAAGASTTVSCVWNTAGDAPGIYTISASATTLNDSNPANDSFTDGIVTLTLGEPRFVRGKLSWTHHLSLAKNADTQTWTAKVRNDAVAPLYVQVVIKGASTDGLRQFTSKSTPVLMASGELRLDIPITETFTGLAGTKFCFTGTVIYSNSAAMDLATGLLAGAVTSVVEKSGCFAVVA